MADNYTQGRATFPNTEPLTTMITNINYCLLIALLCLSCAQADDSKNEINWTVPDLEGHWKLYNTEIVDEVPFLNLKAPEPDPATMVHEDSPWDSYAEYDLVFEKDSMFMVNYPIQAFAPVHYFLDTGYMHVGTEDDMYSYPAELVHDKLFLYRPLSADPGYFKETYVHTSFNDSILKMMKEYKINYPELAGTWGLLREYDYDYGTHYRLNFPYTLPDTISFSTQQMINALHGDRTYDMLTDGKKRPYTFKYHNKQMHLTPDEWYLGNDPWIHFSKWEQGDPFNYFDEKPEPAENEKIEIPDWDLDPEKMGDFTWDFNKLNQAVLLEFPEAYEEFVSIEYVKVEEHISPSSVSFLVPEAKMTQIDSIEIQKRLDRVLLKMAAPNSCAGFEIGVTKDYSWSKWSDKRVTKIILYFC